jgi:hypothetical protein
MKILLTAEQRGSVNAVAPVARELLSRGHDLSIYATGNKNEAAGFGDLPHNRISPTQEAYSRLLRGQDVAVVGMTAFDSPDGHFLRAANEAGIPTVAIQDKNERYAERLGKDVSGLPTIMAVMNEACIGSARAELGDEAANRSRVVGWTAFDHYAKAVGNFTDRDREELLTKIGLDPGRLVHLHLTQSIHPEAAYWEGKNWGYDRRARFFLEGHDVTQFTFEAAADLGLYLVVKPHPGEMHDINPTADLAKRHGFQFIHPKACNTQELMLASNSITAGKSTALNEAALLDINTGGLLPDVPTADIVGQYPAIDTGAIPHTQNWRGLRDIVATVSTENEGILGTLAERRKKFSVDGNASKRLADIVEGLT